MFKERTNKGIIEVSENALHGMVTQYIKSKSIENVIFLGFKKSTGSVIKGISKFFGTDKKLTEEEIAENKLIFDLEFQITKLHPIHTKGKEIQDAVEECLATILGVAQEQIEINVFFTKFQEESEEKAVRTLQ